MAGTRVFSHPEALALWPEGAPAAERAPGGDDVPDGRHQAALLPVLLPGGGPRPLVIVCPGGGYGTHAGHEGLPVAQWLNRLGLHAAVLGYRVWPWRHPAPLHDARQAIRLVRARAAAWNVDGRVGILGFSAGGHLACSAAVLHHLELGDPGFSAGGHRPDACIGCYPVVDLGEWRHDGSRRNLLGAEPDPALVRLLSLAGEAHPQCPPTFLWHTADDAAVPVENSLHLAAALVRRRVAVALHVFQSGQHGLGLAEGHPAGAWTGLCADWLAGLGWR